MNKKELLLRRLKFIGFGSLFPLLAVCLTLMTGAVDFSIVFRLYLPIWAACALCIFVGKWIVGELMMIALGASIVADYAVSASRGDGRQVFLNMGVLIIAGVIGLGLEIFKARHKAK